MIITSLLDTDLYKLTMQQFAFHQRKGEIATYKMYCRSGESLKETMPLIKEEISNFMDLKFTKDEIDYLKSLKENDIRIFKDDYLEFLKYLDLSIVDVLFEDETIIVKGPWEVSILFEVPVLAIVQESYWIRRPFPHRYELSEKITKRKLELLKTDKEFKFIDFGSRRRVSRKWHETIVERFVNDSNSLEGTSNVSIARKLNIKPIGTMAHEHFQAHQGFYPLMDSQKEALIGWRVEYGDLLGIALTDIFNLKKFLIDFDKNLANKYRGVRHDSGDPIDWGNKIINHYLQLGIDPRDKVLVFSDGLTLESAMSIRNIFKDKIKVAFGIGTHVTNDFSDLDNSLKALSLVMKMVYMNEKATIKVSDESVKITSESRELKKKTLQLLEEL
jgi:nicotinate phosphoribosyltransferase